MTTFTETPPADDPIRVTVARLSAAPGHFPLYLCATHPRGEEQTWEAT